MTSPNQSEQFRSERKDKNKLLKSLGLWFGISAAVGNTIAAGIVRTPGNVAEHLPDPLLFLLVWLCGGIYALIGAGSMAEMAVYSGKSGGQFNFARKAFGDYAGFVVGWSDWLSCCGTLAAVALVVAEYSKPVLYHISGDMRLPALAIIAIMTGLQLAGIKWGEKIQLGTSFLKSVAFLGLFVFAVIYAIQHGLPPNTSDTLAKEAFNTRNFQSIFIAFILSLQCVIYTMDGWNGIVYFSEELKNPGEEIPAAIFSSVLSITIIYLLLNSTILLVLPISAISGNHFALGSASNVIFGPAGDTIIRIIMIISLISCINAVILFCSRIVFAMSRDGLFFAGTGKLDQNGTPVRAIILSFLVSSIFVLGTFERVIAMLSFFFVANYAITYAALISTRMKFPEETRSYQAWGYPWTTHIAFSASVIFLLSSLLCDRNNAPLALLALLFSLPLYYSLKMICKTSE